MTDTAPRNTEDQLLGQRYEGYEFKAVLGRGAFGVVYLARHPRLNRDVAVKYLETRAEEDARAIGDEVGILEKISHPHIVRIEDHFPKDNFHFIMMQYVSGGSLRQQLNKLPDRCLDLPTILFLTEQITTALDYIHAQGILHLDLKPENILLESIPGNAAPNFFLTDFGISRLAEKKVDHIAGTPHYMAPEQFGMDGDNPIDRRADIYAFGTILYELVVGFTPFRKSNVIEVAYQHRSEQPRPPSEFVDIPRSVEQVILKALSKNPADRFESAGSLHLALRDATSNYKPTADIGRILNGLAGQYAEEVYEQSVRSVKLPALLLGLTNPDGIEQEYKFNKLPVIAGRDPQADLRLEGDPQVSRKHFKLDVDAKRRLTVTDLESSNHTYLDGQALEPQRPYLWSQAQILTVRGFLFRQISAFIPQELPVGETLGHLVGLLNQVQEKNREPHVVMGVTHGIIRANIGRAEYLKVTVKPHYTPAANYELKILDVPNGINARWLTLPSPKMITDGQSHTFDMLIKAPPVKAGTYDMYIGVVSDNPDIPETGQVVKVVVEPSVRFNLSLKPTPVVHRRFWPRYAELSIDNRSNVDETFTLDVTSHQLLKVIVPSRPISIPQDKPRKIKVRLKPQRGANIVGHLWYTVTVRARSTNDQQEIVGAYQFSKPPVQSISIFKLIVLLLLGMLAAFVLFRLANNIPPDKILQEMLTALSQLLNQLQRLATGAR